jgi:hypothetical protein
MERACRWRDAEAIIAAVCIARDENISSDWQSEVSMPKIKIMVARPWVANSDDEEGMNLLHRERAELLHALATTLDLDVKDWGGTDDTRHHEVVEIIVALGSAGVFSALVEAFKVWVDLQKVKSIEISGRHGTIKLEQATAKDAAAIAALVGLTLR